MAQPKVKQPGWERMGEWDWRVGCPSSHDITQMALSLALTWRGCAASNPCPHPQSQTNHLAHLQMCNSKRYPARELKQTPDCNLTPQQLTHLDCETDRAGFHLETPKTGDSGCMFITRSSMTQLPGLIMVRTWHVFTRKDACSTQICKLRRSV